MKLIRQAMLQETNDHEIPLKNHEHPFIVSFQDADIRTQLGWRLQKDGYVIRYEYNEARKGSSVIFAHRIIGERMLDRPLQPWPAEVVSHINKNLLDCSRPNLRIASMGEAVTARANQRSHASSSYRGVGLHKPSNKWLAYVKVNGKQKHLGSYSSEADAALAYDEAAKAACGDLAQLNFPEQERSHG